MKRAVPVLVLSLALIPASGRAGCLAPSDTAIDTAVGAGPLWGNDSGAALYARLGPTGKAALAVRVPGQVVDDVAVVGDSNGFFVGTAQESWVAFHAGTIDAQNDVAFVASTKTPDDAATAVDESIARRGVYARTGVALYEIARFGDQSPLVDAFSTPVPWGAVFDAVAADEDASGFLPVLFSGQLGGQIDHRLGIFRWNERNPSVVTPVLLTGDASPAGGTFFSLGRLRGNGPGDAAFFGVTRLTDTSPQVPGIFVLRADGSRARVVRFGTDGDPAPGGGSFAIAGDFDMDDAGVVTFAATLVGAPRKTGLFRARPPLYQPESVLFQGDDTPMSGTFGTFANAGVRSTAAGDVVFFVGLDGDVGGDGIFTVAADSADPVSVVGTESVVAIAALGASRVLYQTSTQIRLAEPSDGSEEGPHDFRIVDLDFKNAAPLGADAVRFEARLMLPPWETQAPPTFRSDATRFTPTAALTGAALAKIVEAKVFLSSGPGDNFVFGLGGTDAASTGTYKFNGQAQTVKRLSVKPDGTAATWSFAGNPGPGSCTVDLVAQTIKLSVARATIQPSYEARNFRVAVVLRSADDVAQSRPDDQSYFHRDFRIDARQPSFPGGRRVTSKGENTPGGVVFVDKLTVARKATSDVIQLAGTLRLCPGTVAVVTSKLVGTIHVGSFHLDAVTMTRVGRTGAVYRHAAPGVDFRVDLVKSTFSLKAAGATLLELASAVAGSPTNGPEHAVGGMELDFRLFVPRVYDASFVVPMTRLRGGKVFSR
jgi:hypothetical protein